MDCCHKAMDNPEIIIEDFHKRCKAVCCAARIAYDAMLFFVIQVFIDPLDQGYVYLFCRRRYEDFLCSGIEMLLCSLPVCEKSCAFNNNIYIEIFPGKLLRILLREYLDESSIDDNPIRPCLYAIS